MAVKEMRSNIAALIALAATINSNTTTNGAIVDTANYDLGVTFLLDCTARTDGTYTFQVFESDDSGMSGATEVTGEKLVGSVSAITAAIAQAGSVQRLGVIGTKRYLQLRVVSTLVTTGATIRSTVLLGAELVPVA